METIAEVPRVDSIEHIPILTLATLFPAEFSLDWILAVRGKRATTVLDALEQGAEQGILERCRTGVYAFRDPEKEAERLSMFSEDERSVLHRQIADLIKQEFPDDAEMLPVLAHNLMHIAVDMDDCRVLFQAAEAFRKSYRQPEALRCYEKLIRTLEPLTGADANRLFVDAVLMYARILRPGVEPEWVMAKIKAAIQRARGKALRPFQALLNMHLAKFMYHHPDWHQESLEPFERGWAIAQRSGNPDIIRHATTFRMFFYHWQGRFQDVVRVYGETAPEVSRYPRSRFPVSATNYLGLSLVNCGRVTEGLGMLQGLYDHCREIGDTDNLNLVILSLARVLIETGRVDQGIEVLEELKDIPAEKLRRHFPLSYHLLSAEAFALKGDYEKALLHMGQDITHDLSYVTAIRWDGCNRIAADMAADALYRLIGHTPAEIIERTSRSLDVYNQGMLWLFRARRRMREQRPSGDILEALSQSVSRLKESGHVIQLAKTHLELARVHLALGGQKMVFF